ncbi:MULTISPECIES: hypothetical protein [unclassified Streptomyces]|uniref:hypothetical protein n=1 Tax=unclassified Streptomyces TaxID=2593676 RepID=UPI00343CE87B
MGQADARVYQPLAEHLDDAARAALCLPATPQPFTVDCELADRIREYYFDHPDQARTLTDAVRDLINL